MVSRVIMNNACDNSIVRISCVLKESLMLLLGKYKLESTERLLMLPRYRRIERKRHRKK